MDHVNFIVTYFPGKETLPLFLEQECNINKEDIRNYYACGKKHRAHDITCLMKHYVLAEQNHFTLAEGISKTLDRSGLSY